MGTWIDLTATRKSSSSSPVVTAHPRRNRSAILRLPPSRASLPRPRPLETRPSLALTPLPSSLPSPRRTKSTRSTVTSGLSVPSSTTRVAEMPEQRPRLTRRSESFQEHWKDCKPKDRSALQAAAARNYQPRQFSLYSLLGILQSLFLVAISFTGYLASIH